MTIEERVKELEVVTDRLVAEITGFKYAARDDKVMMGLYRQEWARFRDGLVAIANLQGSKKARRIAKEALGPHWKDA